MVFVFTEGVCFRASDTFAQAAGKKRPGIGIAFRFQNSVGAAGGSGPRFPPSAISAFESSSGTACIFLAVLLPKINLEVA